MGTQESAAFLINPRGTRHPLTIPGVDSSKFGKYTCRAENGLGEDQKTTEVSGKAESAKIKSDPKGGEYDRFTLDWTARSVSPITTFKIEYKNIDEEIWKEAVVEAFDLPQEENTYTGTHMIDSLTPPPCTWLRFPVEMFAATVHPVKPSSLPLE